MFLKNWSSDSLRPCLFSSVAQTAAGITDTISTQGSGTRRIHSQMCTKMTLFVLDAGKASLLKMTLCFFWTEIWQESKGDIQVIKKTLRFIADANSRATPL